MDKNINKIVRMIPHVIQKIDDETTSALMELHKNGKVIVLQYVGEKGISENELLKAVQNSILYYNFRSSQLAVVNNADDMPHENPIVICSEITTGEMLGRKMISNNKLFETAVYDDGIHFVGCRMVDRISNKYFYVHYFKPLFLNLDKLIDNRFPTNC